MEIEVRIFIEYTIDVFERHPWIDIIAIVTRDDYIKFLDQLIERNSWHKTKKS